MTSRPAAAFLWTLALVGGFSLWIRTGFPAQIIAGAAPDDALFVKLARSLVSGRWLGTFDNLTLVKGIGYPAFIALAFVLGIPLKFAESLVYVACSLVVSIWVVRWSASYLLGSVVFTFLALNPAFWSENLSRVVREPFYATLSLGAVLLSVVLMKSTRRSRRRTVALATFTGVIWAWFWLTREEGIWLLPSFVSIVAISVHAWWRGGNEHSLRTMWPGILPLAIMLVTAGSLVVMVATINRSAYGSFETVEVKSAPFERAYGALYRVKPTERVRYVVFPKDVRDRVYAVSPAARELKPYLDGAGGEFWREAGCSNSKLRNCPEILAGWFQWAFRDAVTAAGHYQTAATAAAYYSRLADEVDAACDAKRLDCLAPRKTLAPPFDPAFVTDAVGGFPTLASEYWRAALHVVPPVTSVVLPSEASTDAGLVAEFADMIGNSQPTAEEAKGARVASTKRNRAVQSLAAKISVLYAPILVLLIALSPFGILVLVRHAVTPADHAVLALITGCYVGVFSRIALLCYLDATAIPSLNAAYAAPASGLLIVGAVLGTVGGMISLLNRRSDMAKAATA